MEKTAWNVNYKNLVDYIESQKKRSAWGKGVKAFAIDLVSDLEESEKYNEKPRTRSELKKVLLNGADSWNHYAWSGCGLCYDCDIAEALCNPSELKKTDYGNRRPNSREEWLDVYARAMFQAFNVVASAWGSVVGFDKKAV